MPKAPYQADFLVIGSTYGDRLKEDRSSQCARLKKVLEHGLSNQGAVMIPAFSIGRARELLYELEDIIHRRVLKESAKVRPGASNQNTSKAPVLDWANLQNILNSPLASRSVYRVLGHFRGAEARTRLATEHNPMAFVSLLTVNSLHAHLAMVKRLAQTAQPVIIISGNGMCSSERIFNYLKAMLSDLPHNLLFVGCQAEGTPRRKIQRYGPRSDYVEYDGQRYDIRAQVHTIGGYSAHADQSGLARFVTRMNAWLNEICLEHGDKPARSASAHAFRKRSVVQGNDVDTLLPSIEGDKGGMSLCYSIVQRPGKSEILSL